MNSKFYFLSLLLLVLFSAQTSFAIDQPEELRRWGRRVCRRDDPVRRRDQPPHRQSFARL